MGDIDVEIIALISEHFSLKKNFQQLFRSEKLRSQLEQKELYTLEEAAKVFKMSVLTLRQYVRMGRLKATKEWRNWMISSNQIARLMYEKSHGRKISSDEVMLVLLSKEALPNNLFNLKYQLATIGDLLSIVNQSKADDKIKSLSEYLKFLGFDHIEAVVNMPGLFKSVNQTNRKNNAVFDETILEPEEGFFEELLENYRAYLGLGPEKLLDLIGEKFADPTQTLTSLRLFRTLLLICEKYQAENNRLQELQEKLVEQLAVRDETLRELKAENQRLRNQPKIFL